MQEFGSVENQRLVLLEELNRGQPVRSAGSTSIQMPVLRQSQCAVAHSMTKFHDLQIFKVS